MVSDTPDKPLTADADDIPAEHRIRGIEGARSFTTIEEMLPWAEFMGFKRDGDHLVVPEVPITRSKPRRRAFCAMSRVPSTVGKRCPWGDVEPTK